MAGRVKKRSEGPMEIEYAGLMTKLECSCASFYSVFVSAFFQLVPESGLLLPMIWMG